MAVAANADDYTVGRLNAFFPANNNTPVDGNLTGQCVTLVKWFFAEMCNGFPNPFAARGDARYVGDNLVAQGLAVEVPFAQRRRGDIICYKFGTYGHIVVQLSGGRVFEENVNMPGTTRELVDGGYVYSSRIGNENESWRAGLDPHVYRLNSYKEGNSIMIEPQTIISTFADFGAGTPTADQIKYYGNHPNGYDELHTDLLKYNYQARLAAEAQVADLTKKLAAAGGSVDKAAVLDYINKHLN